MMALWNAVAADGPVGRFGQQELNTYYLAVLVVRILTSSWMVWELTMDIRQGRLATRLLRPLHPLLAYSAEHLAAVPMRALVVSPLVGILVWVMDFQLPLADPVRLGIFAAVAGRRLVAAVLHHGADRQPGDVRRQRAVGVRDLAGHALRAVGLPGPDRAAAGLGGEAEPTPCRSGTCWASRSRPRSACWTCPPPCAHWASSGCTWRAWPLAAMLVWRAGMRRFVAFGG